MLGYWGWAAWPEHCEVNCFLKAQVELGGSKDFLNAHCTASVPEDGLFDKDYGIALRVWLSP